MSEPPRGLSPLARAGASVGFALLRVLAAVMPREMLLALGRAGARAMFAWLPPLRADVLDNASHVLGPGATDDAKRRLAIGVLESFARFAIEVVSPDPGWPVERVIATLRGREHWERAAAAGKGVVAVSLHMGNYEVGPAVLARAQSGPVAIVFNRDALGIFERARARLRRKHRVREIAIGESPFFTIEILAVLRRRGVVVLAGDVGDEAHLRGAVQPFLGSRLELQTLPARIALASGAPILPCFIVRDASGYRLEVREPIFPAEAGSIDAILTRLIPTFEEYVRKYPEQWLCIHRSFAS